MARSFDTRVIHQPKTAAGERPFGSVTPPIFQTSTFTFDSAEQGRARFAGEESGYIYSRLGNPTTRLLELAIADLEGAEDGLSFGSGMAAISAVLIALVKSGDHILVSRGVYGCTFGLLEMLRDKFAVTFTLADLSDEVSVEAAMQPNTKVIYVETPVNPTMELVDLAACAHIAHKSGATVVVDNTFATPVLQRPIEFGADVVVHSATKYLGGHGDVILGLAVGTEELMAEIRSHTRKDIGGIAAPFDAWLVLRGMKTLALRMDRHVETAIEIASRLSHHPAVQQVYYPGLEDYEQRDLYLRQMSGGGGVIGFIVKGGMSAGMGMMNRLELCERAVSLGETHTLIEHPASMTHTVIPPEIRQQMGIDDGLIRLSTGLEDVDDIWEDLNQALCAVEDR
ncbi:methionine gamma-lyase [Alicyclobacillus curvatus]|nr:methionine gamma-lyase [Alicyclobacillus curvatus]